MKRTWWVLAAVLICTGCFDTREEHTVNPDGSGKVVLVSRFQPMSFQMDGKAPDPAQELRDQLRQGLESSEGVEAWRDVSIRRLDDGRAEFTGTAYYRDIAKLKWNNIGFSGLRPRLSHDGKGNIVLDLEPDKQKQKQSPPATPPLSEEALAEKVKAERGKITQMRAMMAGFMENLRSEQIFHLPGTVLESSNLQKREPRVVAVTTEGKKMLALIDELTGNEQWLREQIALGRDLQKDGPAGLLWYEKLYGERAPVRAVFQPQPQAAFDFAVELATARREQPAMMKRLGLVEESEELATATGGEFRKLIVGGVRLVRYVDQRRGVMPFGGQEGVTLALVGDLPGKVSEMTGGEVTKAIADDDSDLLPERDFLRKINFPSLSKDKTTVVFEVKLEKPGKGVRKLKTLAGKLAYSVAGVSSNIDVGITNLRGNVQGSALGAELKAVKPGPFDASAEQAELTVKLDRAAVKKVTFYDAAGAELKVKESGTSWSNGQTTFSFLLTGKFPESGRIVVEKAELKRYEIPFRLTDVSLFE